MELGEYKHKLRQLEMEFNNKKKELAKEYALSNNKYAVGDIFTDHIGSIKIETIKFSLYPYDDIPYCVYYGTELKKDGSLTKKMNKREAYQTNDIKKDMQTTETIND